MKELNLFLGIMNFILFWVLFLGLTTLNLKTNSIDKQVNLLTQQTMSLLIKQGYEAQMGE
jgi:hypothetical protein